ncbi:hypothetical protein ASPBRDRAFT_198340 [Aspergillus brasiliensis CBS 101740]|uniref:Uncharacterized protein n=1 Tax=Aspergillus brasiliensis (strain CBS 101740 / IMI 381727 / IBT 21946) TaxID=767769 RepID=A0A1L9UDF9_ASPBC|nr:hypothetical protein ASPBRDRAFT_198340 [Aspergillus brasiliensis CBS 101740]
MQTNDDTPRDQLNLPLGTPIAANYFRVMAARNDFSFSTATSSGISPSTAAAAAASETSSGAGHKMAVGGYLAGALALVGAVVVHV